MAETDNLQNTANVAGMPDTNANAPSDIERPRVSRTGIFITGFSILLLFLVVGFYLYCFWPIQGANDAAGNPTWLTQVSVICISGLHPEQRMVILVLLSGLLGSLIHGATSFSSYVGDQKLDKNWLWWYALRPLVGMAVAFVFYIVFRGGLVNNTRLESLNIYGVMTLAALAGLFSDRATLKLKEVFETLFQPKDDRSGKLNTSEENVEGSEEAKS